jgi:glycosyltransferase involved in cell wall biosynthesis
MKIENKLEIVIITYNRSKLLENTLAQLLNSPFRNCKITILNNCSTDNTLSVCEKYLDKFSDIIISTNKINIGAGANLLRAVEIVSLDYLWIVCDDDDYDFSYCDDIIDCILNDRVDIINLGAHKENEWKFGGGIKSVKDFVNEGYLFFKASSFVPNNLFRVNKFFPYIVSGYENVSNMYPHMPYLLSNFHQDNLLYISKNRIVTAGIGAQTYNTKDWAQAWLNISKLLINRSDIKQCFFEQWETGFLNEIKSCFLILFSAFEGKIYFKTVYSAFQLLSFLQKIIFSLLLFPYVIYRFIIKITKLNDAKLIHNNILLEDSSARITKK